MQSSARFPLTVVGEWVLGSVGVLPWTGHLRIHLIYIYIYICVCVCVSTYTFM